MINDLLLAAGELGAFDKIGIGIGAGLIVHGAGLGI